MYVFCNALFCYSFIFFFDFWADCDSLFANNISSLAIQKDENEALKAALQRTLKAKEEDLRLYNEIMDETKKVFLHGLRQYRQGQNQ